VLNAARRELNTRSSSLKVVVGGVVVMLFSEVVSLVDELEALGLRFTVTPRMDGSVRLNCWRLPSAWDNRDHINRLLADRVENSQENADQIARYITAVRL
jgi:hypothetical protein